MKKKTIVYDPSMTQDFAEIKVRGKPIPSDFKYIHKSWIWRFNSWWFYRLLAVPILWAFSKIMYRTKVINRKEVLSQLKDTGFFVYSNHTMTADGWNTAAFIAPRRRTYIVSLGGTLTANRFVGYLVAQLGALPLPSDFKSARNFMHCMKTRLNQKGVIAIYPEGTIWPYYNKARVTKKGAFKYPRTFNKPVVFACTTFRKPKGPFKRFLKPRVIITLSDPIFPNRNSVEKIDEQRLQDLFNQFIEKTTSDPNNYCPFDYVQDTINKDYLEEHYDEVAFMNEEQDRLTSQVEKEDNNGL